MQYHEPRIAKGGSRVDPTLPVGRNTIPIPVALNYRNGAGRVLKMQLYKGQAFDVGFLRVFVSTRYRGGSLQSIIQDAPLNMDKDGVWYGRRRGRRDRGPPPNPDAQALEEPEAPDTWDAVTIPLIQQRRAPQ